MSGESFTDLLEPTLPAIRKFVRSKMKMSDQAEDVLQQTLLHAFAHRDQLRASSKFKSWIASIAMNEIRGLARRTRFCLPLDGLPPLIAPDQSACPHKTYERRERAERLYSGLAQLSDRDREAIQMVDFAETHVSEAATKLSVTPSALKSAHYRARRRLSDIVCKDRPKARPRRPGGK